MTQREKLIDLALKCKAEKCDGIDACENCNYFKKKDCYDELLTDYFIDNGVIVLPCKPGERLFVIASALAGESKLVINECEVDEISYYDDSLGAVIVFNRIKPFYKHRSITMLAKDFEDFVFHTHIEAVSKLERLREINDA